MTDFLLVINYLNNNSGFIQSIFTVVLVLITAYYAWQTKKTVNVMKDTEKERNRPKISIFIKQKEDCINLIDLYITNYGNSIAKDIKFVISRDIELNLNKEKLSDIKQIKDGIKNLVPGRKIIIPLMIFSGTLSDFSANDVSIKVEYFDIANNKFKESFILDLATLIEHQIGQPPIYSISKSLKEISKSLKKLR